MTPLYAVTWTLICLKIKYEVKVGIWMSDPYLYYNSIKDTPVFGHLDFNCLKLKYEVNYDICPRLYNKPEFRSPGDVLF